ncbi:Unknown protein, partial [Striga hermonthica]
YNSHIRPKNSSSQIVRSFLSNVCEDLESGSAPITNVADFIASKEQKLFWIHGTIINHAQHVFEKSNTKVHNFGATTASMMFPFQYL